MRTMVTDCLHPKQVLSSIELITHVKDGLPVGEFESLRELLGLSDRELAAKTGISVPTLYRRRQTKTPLDAQTSDRIMRYARLFAMTAQFFEGDQAAARRWMQRPAPALDGLRPLDAADTEVGARAVEQLIGRLEHGVLT